MPLQTYDQYFGPPTRPNVGNLLAGAQVGMDLQANKRRNLLVEQQSRREEERLGMERERFGRQKEVWSEQDKALIKKQAEDVIDSYLITLDPDAEPEEFNQRVKAILPKVGKDITKITGGQIDDGFASMLLGIREDIKNDPNVDLGWLRKGVKYRQQLMGIKEDLTFQQKLELKRAGRAEGRPSIEEDAARTAAKEEAKLGVRGQKPEKQPRPFKITPKDLEAFETRLQELKDAERGKGWPRKRPLTPEETEERTVLQQLVEQYRSQFTPGSPGVQTVPEGVTEADIEFTMQKHGLSREEVLRQIGAK